MLEVHELYAGYYKDMILLQGRDIRPRPAKLQLSWVQTVSENQPYSRQPMDFYNPIPGKFTWTVAGSTVRQLSN